MKKKKNFFRFLVKNPWDFVYLFVIIGGATDIIFSNKDYATGDIVKFLILCALLVWGVILHYRSYKKELSSHEQ
ncbi:MAG: hypothetical protein LBN93_01485 [Candidatus Symbiothrix sp.]|nr:hypothetical protein [Candidatus Symbiothrix sp.]